MRPRIPVAAITAALWAAASLPATPAAAQLWLAEYDYDFASNQVEHFSGTDGWVAGWQQDSWTTAWYEGEANPRTDEEGGSWADSSATANHLTQEAAGPWGNAAVQSDVSILDNDSLGLVLRKSAHDTFYLFVMTTDLMPPTGQGGSSRSGNGAYLYRVHNGSAAELTQNTGSEARYRQDSPASWSYQYVRFEVVGGTLKAYHNPTDPVFQAAQQILEVDDPNPLPPGGAGVYAYQMGEAQAFLGYANFVVELHDADGDGVPDDQDTGDDDTADDDTADDDAADDDAGDDDAADDDAADDDDADDDASADDDADDDTDGSSDLPTDVSVASACDCGDDGAAPGALAWLPLTAFGVTLWVRRR